MKSPLAFVILLALSLSIAIAGTILIESSNTRIVTSPVPSIGTVLTR